MTKRTLAQVQPSQPVTDGDGVKINRSVAHRALHSYDPFLLLDEIAADDAADYIGGFPEHPHRGFETVTYMLEGSMKHRDHMGNEGLLVSGGVQWMTAGRGVLHSEMPQQEEGRLHGFQLWINLPAAEKMSDPQYQEYRPADIPEVHSGNTSVRVIAGSFTLDNTTVTGPVKGVTTQPDYLDIRIAAGDSLELPVDNEKRVLVYVYAGKLEFDDEYNSKPPKSLQQRQLGVLENGDSVSFTALEDSRLLFLAGKPIGEPVVNWGPFVMNTREEIDQAILDYRNGTLV